MAPTSALPKNFSSIPNIKQLQSKLNYGSDRGPWSMKFRKHLQAFWDDYKSPLGVPGHAFSDWNNEGHMKGLGRMVDTYLDENDGASFWPDDQDAPEYSELRYSADHKFIKTTLIQLFFQKNKQRDKSDKFQQKKRDNENDDVRQRDNHRPRNSGLSTAEYEAAYEGYLNDPSAGRSSNTLGIGSSSAIQPSSVEAAEGLHAVPENLTTGPRKPRPSIKLIYRRGNASTGSGSGVQQTPSARSPEKAAEKPQDRVDKAHKDPTKKRKRNKEDQTIYRNPPRDRRRSQRYDAMATPEEVAAACATPAPSTADPGTSQDLERDPFEESQDLESEIIREPSVGDRAESRGHDQLETTVQTIVDDLPPTNPGPSAKGKERALDIPKTPDAVDPYEWPTTPPSRLADEPSHASPPKEATRAFTEASSSRAPAIPRFPSRTLSPIPRTVRNLEPVQNPHHSEGVAPVANMEPRPMEIEEVGESSAAPAQQIQSPSVTSAKEPATPSGPNTEFLFVIIHSRVRWRAQYWIPEGKFLRKTLPQLKAELPPGFADNAPGLLIRLIGPGFREEGPVVHGEDNAFMFMTKDFRHKIGNIVKKYAGAETLSFRIEIEGLPDDYIAEANNDIAASDDTDYC